MSEANVLDLHGIQHTVDGHNGHNRFVGVSLPRGSTFPTPPRQVPGAASERGRGGMQFYRAGPTSPMRTTTSGLIRRVVQVPPGPAPAPRGGGRLVRREEASRARLTPTPPSPRAALLAFARSSGRSPGRRRVLSKRRARAPLPPSASWYPFPRYAQCATLASIGPHRSIGLLVGPPRRTARILVEMCTGVSV